MTTSIKRHAMAGIDYTIAEPLVTGAELNSKDSKTTKSSRETLVCLHGIGGDDASFLPQSEQLSGLYRVIAWNMPGYRQSPSLKEYTFANLAAALVSFLDEQGLGQVHLIGQSIGGMIAQEMAHRHAHRVKSLTLIATTSAFGGRDESFKVAFLAARLKPLDEGVSMQELAAQSVPQITGGATSADVLASAVDSMAAVRVETYREVLKCLVSFDRRSELTNLACPVCLIAGSEDTNSPAVTMKKMAAKLCEAEFHELQGAGHLVNLEMADKVNEIITRFLGKYCSHE